MRRHTQEVPNAEQLARQRLMGQRVKEAREDLGITQEELADRLGVDQSMVARYEIGESAPRPPRRRKLEQLLKLKPGELAAVLEPEADGAALVRQALEERLDEFTDNQRTTNDLLRELLKKLK